MTNLNGAIAEELVVKKLQGAGWFIEAQNWHAPGVEVDIIASNKGSVYLVEVKLRTNPSSGDGFSAIGQCKLAKLEQAASLWQLQDRNERPIELIVAAVDRQGVIELRNVY